MDGRGTGGTGWGGVLRLAAIVVGLLLWGVPAAEAAKPRPLIIFDRHITQQPFDNDIFSIRPDGSHENIVVDTDYDDWGVAASPDSKLLAFTSQRDADGNDEIYVMRQDGSHLQQLTHTGMNTYNEWPSFTPDGKRILFDSNRKGDVGQIFAMRTDGSHQHALTNDAHDNFDAVMSPNGKQIAFAGFRGTSGNEEILRARADGSHERRLTHTSAREELPSYFPNSEKLAFESDRDGDDELFTMKTDGSNLRRLTKNTGIADREPAVSRNGQRIAFVRVDPPAGDSDIWVMQADGSGPHAVTDNTQFEEYPDWAKLP